MSESFRDTDYKQKTKRANKFKNAYSYDTENKPNNERKSCEMLRA